MSRIGKAPIAIPNGVTAAVADGRVTVHGPKGELVVPIHPVVTVTVSDGVAAVTVARPQTKDQRALWGLTARLLQNAIAGVTKGFERKLDVQGVGFRAEVKGSALELHLGFSHPIQFPLPSGVTATVEKNIITIQGIDVQCVGETAARLRTLRTPDAYHGKGIRYFGEVLKLKPGKAVKAAGAA
ncbi:MAG: 50S ribosomal protein L6 [bacterium]|nr:50S ribosomal protein L6 [bacterium]